MKPLGKKKCEVLKEVRKKIALANGISYEPAVCTHDGDCLGTCPQCEAEVKYIEKELKMKKGGMRGVAAALIGSTIAVSSLGVSSCSHMHIGQVVGLVVKTDTVYPPEPLTGKPAVPIEQSQVSESDTITDTPSSLDKPENADTTE